MKQKKVWRYYCDFCGKAGCGKAAMIKHEKHCTLNPQRECRMCKTPRDYSVLVKLLVPHTSFDDFGAMATGHDVYKLDDTGLGMLRKAVQCCPACILTSMRLACAFTNSFNFKESVTAWWAEKNEVDCVEDERAYY